MAVSKVILNGTTLMDSTTATAVASDIASPKTALLASGVMTEGTGPSATVEAEKKAVNFYDYDGFRLYSYTAAEAQALEALPSNPSHTGLTAQGWNWTLAQIKSQLTNVGGIVNVGQNYVTSDGKTYIDIELDDPNFLHPYFTAAVNGTIVVDWGDNSTSTMTGTSDSTNLYTHHTYSSIGKYTIVVTVSSGNFTFRSGGYTGILEITNTGGYRNSDVYSSKIKSIRLGSNAAIGQYAFWTCVNMVTITIPSTITSIGIYAFCRVVSLKYCVVPSGVTEIGNYMFSYCVMLESVSLPSSITTIGEAAFYLCYNLNGITIPASVTTLGKNAFNSCMKNEEFKMPSGIQTIPYGFLYNPYTLKYVTLPSSLTTVESQALYSLYSLDTLTIPATVTSIASKAFYGLYALRELHFLGTTPPTLAASDAFTSIQTFCTIYVPTGYLSAYTSASNYPSSATYTYVEE